MSRSAKAPTQVRWLSPEERNLVTDVFGNTLPYFQRIWITNGLGADGAPFTVPTSAVTALGIIAPMDLLILAGTKNPAVAALATAIVGTSQYVSSAFNVGFIMSVGSGPYPDMAHNPDHQALLVHEMTHVWQGKNSTFALSYVINAALSQCNGIVRQGGIDGRNSAYDARPGDPWNKYNAEQQARMVELWYAGGKSETSQYFRYIRDNIRKGHNS